ncbi:MAG: hypothetical protein HWE14_08330 [Flavobacteriia bacterium]|nr:hypothetical protein [Flavobacteriia bacterium]
MNAAISLNRKRASVIFQVILVLLTVIGIFVSLDYGWVPICILAAYQPLSSIYYRAVIKADIGGMRDGYDAAIGFIGMYFGIAALAVLIEFIQTGHGHTDEAWSFIAMIVAGLMLMVPVILTMKHRDDSTLRLTFIFLAIVLGAIAIPATLMGSEIGLLMMYFGMWVMLLASPILAITYIVIESIELAKEGSASKHNPLDL